MKVVIGILCIICAMDLEYKYIFYHYKIEKEFKINDFLIAESENRMLVLVKSGIGKSSAAICTHIILKMYPEITCVLSVGIAGALDPVLLVGDIVVSERIIDYSKERQVVVYQTTNDIEHYFDLSERVHIGTVISSDNLVQEAYEKQWLYTELSGTCVEMESAAMGRICQKKKIPFSAIKVISDYADKEALRTMIRTQISVSKELGFFIYSLITKYIKRTRL